MASQASHVATGRSRMPRSPMPSQPTTAGLNSAMPLAVLAVLRFSSSISRPAASAVRRVSGAVALCSYTTIVGYGSLIFNDNQALESFGWLAMVGEFATLIAALFVLPSLLHLWKAKPGEVHGADQITR